MGNIESDSSMAGDAIVHELTGASSEFRGVFYI